VSGLDEVEIMGNEVGSGPVQASAGLIMRDNLASIEKGRQLLEIVLRCFPFHTPERYGCVEPLKQEFTSDLNDALKSWKEPLFIMAKRSPRFHLMVNFRKPKSGRDTPPSSISLFRFDVVPKEGFLAVRDFLCQISEGFGVLYGWAHILTATELEGRLADVRRRQPASASSEARKFADDHMRRRIAREGFAPVLRGMITTRLQLERCLPDLRCFNLFGPEYVKMFGRERLLSTPAGEVNELFNGGVCLSLANCLEDNQEAYEEFRLRSQRCKNHLGSDAFCDPDAPSEHRYRVPDLTFMGTGRFDVKTI